MKKNRLISVLSLSLILSQSALANDWSCQEKYENYVTQFKSKEDAREIITLASFVTVAPAATVGAFIVLAPLTGGLSLLLAPITGMGVFIGGFELFGQGQYRVQSYELLKSADHSEAELNEIHIANVSRVRQELIQNEKKLKELLDLTNREARRQSIPELTIEELIHKILNEEIFSRYRNPIDFLVEEINRKTETPFTYEDVRSAVLAVRENPDICSGKKPSKVKKIKKLVKQNLNI